MLGPWPIRTAAFSGPGTSTWSPPWSQWLSQLRDTINSSGQRVSSVSTDSDASASVTTTAFPFNLPNVDPDTVTQGRYRVTDEMRVTRAATVSSSLTVTIGWTDDGVACTYAFTPLTSNTTASVQSDTKMVNADQGTAITYAVAYASVGATTMQYRFSALVEQMPS